MEKRIASEHQFTTYDGTQLFYRKWEPIRPQQERRALLILHRGHEHTGRLQALLEELELDEYYAFGFDLRGHGRSPGPRGYAPDFSAHVKDLDVFARMISQEYKIPLQNLAVIANSVGAVIASTWVHDYAPEIRCMALAAPAFDIKLYVPLALPGLKILNAIKSPAFISSYVKAKFLTHDPDQVRLYENDPLITRDISVNILLGLYENSKRIVQDAQAIHTPTLVLSAGSDWVVHQKPQREFVTRLGSKVKEFVEYPGFYHGVLYEKERNLPLSKIRNFVKTQFEVKTLPVPYLSADRQGFTYEEYHSLSESGVSLPKALFYAVQRGLLSTLGRLSKGISLGLKTGFDSGLSLDHIYKNQATGIGPIGKLVDYFYINQLGWKGIRQRKLHLQEALDSAITSLILAGKPVRILDIAAGGGRYLIETAKKYQNADIHICIRDNELKNIEEAKRTAAFLGVRNVTFQTKDAFDPTSYKNPEFKPNIVIVSGLYELFPQNDQVLKSIKGIASIVQEEGTLIYTGQPWHPQLELIAHTLNNREQKKWIMRRRTQGELDALMRECGFEKSEMKIDRWGIFTVSTALRRSSSCRPSNESFMDENIMSQIACV